MSEQLFTNIDSDDNITREELACSFFREFYESIEQSGKGYDLSIVKLEERKPPKTPAYSRITVADNPIFRIYGKRVLNISVNTLLVSLFTKNNITFKCSDSKNNSDDWKRLNENEFHCLQNASNLAVEIIEKFLRQNGFGCCSRYEACSDAGHCIHPDIMLAVQCAYRQNLINGKVFYGKNRNT